MAADTEAALVDARLFGRLRAYGGNCQEWNDFKFVFKSYIGVVAHLMLAAMIHAETLRASIMLSLSKMRTATRSSSAGHCRVPMAAGSRAKVRARASTRRTGKEKARAEERAKKNQEREVRGMV